MSSGSGAALSMDWARGSSSWDLRMTSPERGQEALQAEAPDLASAEDRELIAAFLGGSPEAFDVMVERHRRHVYQLCYRFVGNHEDASDLAQDVFVRAFKGLRNFKGDSSLGTWLYRVAVNASLNRLAVKQPVTEPVDAARLQDVRTENPLERVLRGERAVEVRAAIQRLPPKQRATLLLRVYRELPHEEIAKILGSSVGAVKANFFHALANLKRRLESR
jgi:RNA polymerase sigma-70 factor, ECF subfamily